MKTRIKYVQATPDMFSKKLSRYEIWTEVSCKYTRTYKTTHLRLLIKKNSCLKFDPF